MAKKITHEADEDQTQPEAETQSVREWTYGESARFQLTGEYPEWYKPQEPVDVQPTDKT